ncbi:MAG: hypothetical protein KA035_03545, partial [Candidatus Levybacteria bacterium]|nr:hypothetical protein [Candidatus Levybacteria bacterium]
NYRARILHHSFLFVFIAAFLSLSCGVYVLKQSRPDVLGISYTISEQDLLENTNKQRSLNGAAPLQLNPKLSDAARRKVANMFENNYWAHFAPNGTTPWSFIKAADYEYLFAGENLAKGFTSSSDVVNAWMNSPTHRENLLSSKYTEIGFAIQEGHLTGEDTVVVVQMFGKPLEAQGEQIASLPEAPNLQIAQAPNTIPALESEVKSEQQVVLPEGKSYGSVVNAPSATKSLSIVFLVFIITVLLLDLIIVERRKIPRIMGHNLDHIIILILFLVFIFLERTGGIL